MEVAHAVVRSKLGLPLVNQDSPKMFSLVYAAIAHEAAPNELPSA